MSLILKIICIYLGLVIAKYSSISPIAGIGLGFVLGQLSEFFIGRKILRWHYSKIFKKKAQNEFNQRFITNLFALLAKVCAVDGAINKRESDSVDYIMTNVLTLDRNSRKLAKQVFQNSGYSQRPFQTNILEIIDLYQLHPEMYHSVFRMCMKVASDDSPMNIQEAMMLRSIAAIFAIDPNSEGLEEQNYFKDNDNQKQQKTNKAEEKRAESIVSEIELSYNLLGCSPNDPPEIIKKKYRKLVSEYHPDKIVSKDLPEDFLKFANDKLRTIQSAYEFLKSVKGFN